ncbi:MAG: cbb3-type cytochrome oxidase assembly protein CcoS [Pirellulaceae bacterium]|jgi:cbb3-type cytochrome oxidase maturation protein
MSVLFLAVPIALLFAGGAVVAFWLAARQGQFDDLDTPAWRMLQDEADRLRPSSQPLEEEQKSE